MRRELQRLHAPKVKIILQSVALSDPSYLKHNTAIENINQAKRILSEYFLLSFEIFDDDFFKTHLKSFEPVLITETKKITSEIMS